MIKIIKPGKEQKYRKNCNQCDALLEMTDADTKLDTLYSGSCYTYIICPCCHHKIIITIDGLPTVGTKVTW